VPVLVGVQHLQQDEDEDKHQAPGLFSRIPYSFFTFY